jgi:hypothetical protein
MSNNHVHPNVINALKTELSNYQAMQDSSLLHSIQTGSGAHLASYTMGTGGSFPGGKANHSPPSTAEVKNGGAIPTSTSPISLHGMCLTN